MKCGVVSQERVGRIVYACASYHRRGASVCGNRLLAPLPTVHPAILDGLRRYLDPGVLRDAARVALEDLYSTEERSPGCEAAIRSELAQIDTELARPAAAIGSGGSLPTLVAALTEREGPRAVLQAKLMRLAPRRPPIAMDRWRVHRELEETLEDTRRLLTGQAGSARQVLRQLFPARLVFTPRQDEAGTYYAFRVKPAMGKLFEGTTLPQAGVSPTGHVRWWHGC